MAPSVFMAKNEEWKAGEWKRLEREECKRSILAGAALGLFLFFFSFLSFYAAAGRFLRLRSSLASCSGCSSSRSQILTRCWRVHTSWHPKKQKKNKTAKKKAVRTRLRFWTKKRKRDVSFVTLIKGWAPFVSRVLLVFSSFLFQSVCRGQRSAGGARCTCSPSVGLLLSFL